MRSQVWEELKEGCSKQREQQVQKPKGGQELERSRKRKTLEDVTEENLD